MIDHFALILGHALMAIAVVRLLLRPDLDIDPLIDGIGAETRRNRMASSASGRNAARRASQSREENTQEPLGSDRAETTRQERDA